MPLLDDAAAECTKYAQAAYRAGDVKAAAWYMREAQRLREKAKGEQ